MRNKKDAQNAGEAVSETPSSRFPLHAGGTEAERFPSRSGMRELPSLRALLGNRSRAVPLAKRGEP
jgi:hypothetical protein